MTMKRTKIFKTIEVEQEVEIGLERFFNFRGVGLTILTSSPVIVGLLTLWENGLETPKDQAILRSCAFHKESPYWWVQTDQSGRYKESETICLRIVQSKSVQSKSVQSE